MEPLLYRIFGDAGGMDAIMTGIPLLAFGGDTPPWLIYALAAVTIVYVVVRPMLRRKQDPLQRPPNLSLSQQRSVEREMSNLLVELSEMARQITAQLDTRAARLESLIEEADRRIEQLRAAGKVAGRTAVEQPMAPVAVPERSHAAAPPDNRYGEVYGLADKGHSARDIALRLNRPQGEVELILALRRH